jgi:ABC-type molybdate transport system substrate-binding protein
VKPVSGPSGLGSFVAVVLATALGGVACKRGAPPAPPREDRVLVFVAEPLRDAFSTMQPDFQWSKPGVEVQLTFGDAHELGTKIERGAAFDVVAACDDTELAALERGRRVVAPVAIARDEAVVIVAGTRAAKVATLAQLSEPTRQRLLALAGAHGRDSAATVAKVVAGEAEAALVSRTALRELKDRVGTLPLPPGAATPTTCTLAVSSNAPHPVSARAWSDFVRGSTGQQTLRDAGLLAP